MFWNQGCNVDFLPFIDKPFFWGGGVELQESKQNTESLQFGFLVSQLLSFYSYVQNNKCIARWAGVWWKGKAGIYSSVQYTVAPVWLGKFDSLSVRVRRWAALL